VVFLRTLSASTVAALSLVAPALAEDGPAPPPAPDPSVAQAAAETAGDAAGAAAAATATATQSAPGNINISVRVGSSGDDGAVSQGNTAGAAAGAENASPAAQAGGTGSQGDAPASQAGAAGSQAGAGQAQPSNINVSVRVNSPGDNGPVNQQNTAAAGAAAAATPDPAPVPEQQYHQGDPQYQPSQGADQGPDRASATPSDSPGPDSAQGKAPDGEAAASPSPDGQAAPAGASPTANDSGAANDAAEAAATWNWTWNWDCATTPDWSEILAPGATPDNFTWNWTWNWECGGASDNPDQSSSPPADNSTGSPPGDQAKGPDQYQGNTQQYQPGNSAATAQSTATAAQATTQTAVSTAQTAISLAGSALAAPSSAVPAAPTVPSDGHPTQTMPELAAGGDEDAETLAQTTETLAQTIVSSALEGATRLHPPGGLDEPPGPPTQTKPTDPAAAAKELGDKIASTAVATARGAVTAATAAVPVTTRAADAAIFAIPRAQKARPQHVAHSTKRRARRGGTTRSTIWREQAQAPPALDVAATREATDRLLRRTGAPDAQERPQRQAHGGGAATPAPGAPNPFVPKPVSAVGGSSAGSGSAAGSFLIAGLTALLAYALFPPELGGRLRPTSDRRRLRPRSSRLERPG
jgi:hypothetical protein